MTDSKAEARRQKILARGQERLSTITGGGSSPEKEPAKEGSVSRSLNFDSAESSHAASDKMTPAASGAHSALHAARLDCCDRTVR